MSAEDIQRDAVLSDDGVFRFSLLRSWKGDEPLSWAVFCGLNPSMADGKVDDPTTRREIAFAKSLGATGLLKVNITPFRAKDPSSLRAKKSVWSTKSVREANFAVIRDAVSVGRGRSGVGVFAAWGSVPKCLRYERELAIVALGTPIMCFGLTLAGEPRHTLYLPKTTVPQEWWQAEHHAKKSSWE